MFQFSFDLARFFSPIVDHKDIFEVWTQCARELTGVCGCGRYRSLPASFLKVSKKQCETVMKPLGTIIDSRLEVDDGVDFFRQSSKRFNTV